MLSELQPQLDRIADKYREAGLWVDLMTVRVERSGKVAFKARTLNGVSRLMERVVNDNHAAVASFVRLNCVRSARHVDPSFYMNDEQEQELEVVVQTARHALERVAISCYRRFDSDMRRLTVVNIAKAMPTTSATQALVNTIGPKRHGNGLEQRARAVLRTTGERAASLGVAAVRQASYDVTS